VGKKILVIDEDLALVKSLERTLCFCGFEVLDAPDGMLGVQKALRYKPDLIILELLFPAGGAHFVLKNLRRSLITRDIPVLILTSSTDSQAKKHLLQFGVLTYLQKPCDREELLAQILELLGTPAFERSYPAHDSVITTGDFTRSSPSPRPTTLPNQT
jgi:DNA-binding response OmpR family regulator